MINDLAGLYTWLPVNTNMALFSLRSNLDLQPGQRHWSLAAIARECYK